ncbi:hypothetical protein IW140_001288 [Coemansia sp. RSA 1813]|nr:hypothetical protein IW140_001288 [Coemansia sp. RSA 1813]
MAPLSLPESTLLKDRGYTVDHKDAYSALAGQVPRHSRSFSNIQYNTYRHQHAFNDTYFAHTVDPPPMPTAAAVPGSYIMDKDAASIPQTPPSSGKPNDASWFKDERPPPMPGSDSKYSSYTVAARGSEHRRVRGQRRKTDCSDEIQASVRRPSTSHSSSPSSRKVTYSQYPDFETITDPFAKRDKIPRKSIKPLFSDAPSANESNSKPPNPDDMSGTTSSSPTLQPPLVSQLPAEQGQLNGVPAKHAQYPNSMSIALRKQQPPAAEPIQMEPLDTSLPGSPAPSMPRKAGDARSSRTGQSVVPAGTIPLSPLSQTSQPPPSARTADSYYLRNESLFPRALDVKTTEGSAMIRPFSGHHLNSPRLDIDMDKVETLYARSSVIFEKNKQRREARSRVDSAVAEPDSLDFTAAVRNKGKSGLGGMASDHASSPLSRADSRAKKHATADKRRSYEYNSVDDDIYDLEGHHEGEDYIPFDQVLIPTAFKRLRAAIEDPNFEIDEETYRRFKLSERWYAREVHAQMERTFAIGTFGESKDRGRIDRKDHSENSTEAPPQDDPSTIYSAVHRNDRLANATRSDSEQDIPMSSINQPTRKRTSSRRRSQRSGTSSNGSHRRYPIPAQEVPQVPQVFSPRSKQRPARGHSLARRETHDLDDRTGYVPPQLQTAQARQDSLNYTRNRDDVAALRGQADLSSHVRRAAPIHHHDAHTGRRSERKDSQQQPEQQSSGCCGCTIM